MYVICKNNYPVEVVNGTTQQADKRRMYLRDQYCEKMNVSPQRVLFAMYRVPVYEPEEPS